METSTIKSTQQLLLLSPTVPILVLSFPIVFAAHHFQRTDLEEAAPKSW